ncbi:MAG TPA: choice-of-anchor R domain-containing protein [Xanthomonadaceae bacterium]|nr:choice-of-anchor R domain-containing protein [Xanthomonadaceae bacterium]
MRNHCLLLVLAAWAVAPDARATPILGNMPPDNDATQTAAINDQRQKAYRFTIGPDSLVAGDLILRLRNYDAPGEAIAELRDANTDTAPGSTVLLTFVAPPPGGGGIDNYTFVPQDTFVLQASTTYWIVVLGVADGAFDWMASNPGIAPAGLATYGSSSFTSNGGSDWGSSTLLTTFAFFVDGSIFSDGFESPL